MTGLGGRVGFKSSVDNDCIKTCSILVTLVAPSVTGVNCFQIGRMTIQLLGHMIHEIEMLFDHLIKLYRHSVAEPLPNHM